MLCRSQQQWTASGSDWTARITNCWSSGHPRRTTASSKQEIFGTCPCIERWIQFSGRRQLAESLLASLPAAWRRWGVASHRGRGRRNVDVPQWRQQHARTTAFDQT